MHDLDMLHKCLDAWRQSVLSAYPDSRASIMQWYRLAENHLPALLSDNSRLSAEELETVAQHLSPGGAHNSGELIRRVLSTELGVDPRLLTAILRENWRGGKIGFQFLPDPAKGDPSDYDWEAQSLYDRIKLGHGNNPRIILTGQDLAFYNGLPDRFSVYRGCSGVSAEVAGMGLCWTLDRPYAEWFATRGKGIPVLVSARIRKGQVALAFASEGGEVVVRAKRSRELVCRPQSSRPIVKIAPAR